MGKKISFNEFKERVDKIYNGTIDLSEYKFENTQNKGHCKCKICGYEWDVRGYSLLAGHGCRKCYDKRNSDRRKIPFDDIQKIIDEQGKGVKIIGDFVDTKHECLAKCFKCGHEWRTNVRDLMKGHGCPECVSIKKDFYNKLFSLYGEKYDCSDVDYKTLNDKIKLVCKKHGDFYVFARKIWGQESQTELCPYCIEEIKKEKIRIENRIREKKKEENRKKIEEERLIRKQEKERLLEEKKKERGYIKRRGEIMPNDVFIQRCIEKHGEGTFTYEKTNLKNWSDKVIVTCPIHGDVEKAPASLLAGHGCPKCSNMHMAYTTEEWVEKAKKRHHDFSYDNVNYVNKTNPVIVTCPVHGDVSVYPNAFIREDEPCPKCRMDKVRREKSKEYWDRIEELYDGRGLTLLNKGDVIKIHSKISVRCEKHDFIFTPTVNNILSMGCGCPKCANSENGMKTRSDIDEVKEKINRVHNFKYDLSRFIEYNGYEKKIPVICPEHGLFYKTPHSLIAGHGCPECGKIMGGLNLRLTQEEFIERVTDIHYGKDLDFSESVYDGGHNNVKVICKKHDKFGNIHGEFFINAGRLLIGNGCPKCNSSHLEQYVRSVLLKNNVNFEEQKRFNWLRNDKTNRPLILDFYLPDYNIAIECQGMQHFSHEFYKYKGVEKCKEHLIDVQYRDKRKKELCKENGVNLIYFIKKEHYKYMQNESNPVFTNLDEMLTYIQSFDKEIDADGWRLCSDLL